MTQFVSEAIGLATGHPAASVCAAIAVVLYLNLMLSGPRAR
jgi:hypothetical protein